MEIEIAIVDASATHLHNLVTALGRRAIVSFAGGVLLSIASRFVGRRLAPGLGLWELARALEPSRIFYLLGAGVPPLVLDYT